jgi:hypothetical protein
MPRWVKVFVIIVGVLLLLLVIGRLTGVGGEHGPGRHGPGAQVPDDTDHANVTLTAEDTLHDLVADEIDFHLPAARDETIVGGPLSRGPGPMSATAR